MCVTARFPRLLGDAEVDQHDPVVLVEQDVLGLQITVHDGRRPAVEIGEDLAELVHPRHQPPRRDGAAAGLALALEALRAPELEHQVHHPVDLEVVADVGDGRVPEAGQERRLVLVVEVPGKLLERPALALEPLVGDQVGGREPPLPEHARHPVAPLHQVAGGEQPAVHLTYRAVGRQIEVRQLQRAARAVEARLRELTLGRALATLRTGVGLGGDGGVHGHVVRRRRSARTVITRKTV